MACVNLKAKFLFKVCSKLHYLAILQHPATKSEEYEIQNCPFKYTSMNCSVTIDVRVTIQTQEEQWHVAWSAQWTASLECPLAFFSFNIL